MPETTNSESEAHGLPRISISDDAVADIDSALTWLALFGKLVDEVTAWNPCPHVDVDGDREAHEQCAAIARDLDQLAELVTRCTTLFRLPKRLVEPIGQVSIAVQDGDWGCVGSDEISGLAIAVQGSAVESIIRDTAFGTLRSRSPLGTVVAQR